MAFVPDASVAAAWVLPDEEAAVADLALDRLGEETATVPEIFWHELRNVLLSTERRGRIVCPGEIDDHEVVALASPDRRLNEAAAAEGVASFA